MSVKAELYDQTDAQQLLTAFIESGGYQSGDRLPAERELVENLGISRSALRKGLDTLERQGTI